MKTPAPHRQVLAVVVAGLLVALALLATGCNAGSGQSTGVASSPPAQTDSGGGAVVGGESMNGVQADKSAAAPAVTTPEGTAQRSAAGVATADAARMVVRTVSMRLNVDDVDKTARRVGTLAGAYKGYVESMQVSTDAGGPIYLPMDGSTTGQSQTSPAALSGYVTVRVPASSLERFRADVAALGKVVFESTDSQDVTAQHADLKARLKNLEATEAGLRRLFDKAKTVTEMLAIQNELTQVQGEIESLTAQIKVLDSQAAMSTVTVQLVGPEPVVSPQGEDWGFTTALRESVRGFVQTINVLIVSIGYLLPVIIIVVLFILLVVWLVRRSSRKSKDATAEVGSGAADDDGPAPAAASSEDRSAADSKRDA